MTRSAEVFHPSRTNGYWAIVKIWIENPKKAFATYRLQGLSAVYFWQQLLNEDVGGGCTRML